MSFRHLVRIKSTDLEGYLPVTLGLSRISGVNRRLAETIVRTLKIPLSERIGYLTDSTIKEIEGIISDPTSAGIPAWLVNRRKDRQTGDDLHITEAQLILQTKQDVERYIRIRNRRGIRHSFKLKVRGQRTRTHGRRGTTVGVSKKKRA
jgi:small subunit ribosomal protein S13